MKHIKKFEQYNLLKESMTKEEWEDTLKDLDGDIERLNKEILELPDGSAKKLKRDSLAKVEWIKDQHLNNVEVTPDMLKSEPRK